MGISALLASQILDASATGRSVITGADSSAIRTTLGLGTLATQSPTGTPSASTFLRGDFSWQTIDLSGYVPYSGATGAVNLGANDLQTSADIVIAKDRGGYTTGNIFATTAKTGANIYIDSFGQFGFYSALTGTSSIFGADPVGLMLASSRSLAWTNGNVFGVRDTVLARDGAGILGIRNSTNAQRLNLYGTYTDASNYRRLFLSSTTAGAFTLGVEGAGTGASGNTLTVANATTFSGVVRATSFTSDGTGSLVIDNALSRTRLINAGAIGIDLQANVEQLFRVTYAGTEFPLVVNRSGLTVAGRTLTGSEALSALDLSGTWNTTGTPTLIKANVTDTASNANSLLMDLQVGGSSRFRVAKDGRLIGNSWGITNDAGFTRIDDGSSGTRIALLGDSQFQLQSQTWFIDRSASSIDFSTAGTRSFVFSPTSNIFQLRRTTNAQVLQVYNTFTDASNYERGQLAWQSNQLRIGVENAGTGSTRTLALGYWSAGNFVQLFYGDTIYGNVWIGQGAGQGSTNYGGNVAIGANALGSTTTNNGSGIVAIGSAALRYLTVANSSDSSVAIGSDAGVTCRAATTTTLIGGAAGRGSSNFTARLAKTTSVGYESGYGFDATTLTGNSFFGYRAGYAVSSGNNNTCIGSEAGDAITTGSNNIAIGYNVDVDSATASNQINIGNVYYHDRIAGAKTFSGNVTVSAVNLVTDTTTGTKIGTATTQKLGLWNATPIEQPTTAVGSATVASPGGGSTIKTDDTFDGYTIQQVVKALRNFGLLA